MTERRILADELSNLFNILSHPDRVRLIEELATKESDVHTLSEALGIADSRVSQHLGLLRALRLVQERRDGKHHYYRLTDNELAHWILKGTDFTTSAIVGSPTFDKAAKKAISAWSPIKGRK